MSKIPSPNTCKLTIGVDRSRFFQDSKIVKALPFNLGNALSQIRVLEGVCVYIQLEDAEKNKTSFFYDSKFKNNEQIAIILGVSAANFALVLSADNIPFVLSSAFFAVASIICLGTASPGKVQRLTYAPNVNTGITFDIPFEKYTELRHELSALAAKKRNGIYSILFNNCASYAARFANNQGYETPNGITLTPSSLAKKIDKLSGKTMPLGVGVFTSYPAKDL